MPQPNATLSNGKATANIHQVAHASDGMAVLAFNPSGRGRNGRPLSRESALCEGGSAKTGRADQRLTAAALETRGPQASRG